MIVLAAQKRPLVGVSSFFVTVVAGLAASLCVSTASVAQDAEPAIYSFGETATFELGELEYVVSRDPKDGLSLSISDGACFSVRGPVSGMSVAPEGIEVFEEISHENSGLFAIVSNAGSAQEECAWFRSDYAFVLFQARYSASRGIDSSDAPYGTDVLVAFFDAHGFPQVVKRYGIDGRAIRRID